MGEKRETERKRIIKREGQTMEAPTIPNTYSKNSNGRQKRGLPAGIVSLKRNTRKQ